jgi:PS-10 peptidase S37
MRVRSTTWLTSIAKLATDHRCYGRFVSTGKRPARWIVVFGIVLVAASCHRADGGGPDSGPGDSGPDATPGESEPGDGACSGVVWAAPPGCAATDLEGKLRCIPGLTVTPQELTPPLTGYRRFDLVLDQPIDHDHPELGTLQQRAMLLHISDTAPMVLTTSGYGLGSRNGLTEITRQLNANQIAYEHRYFGPSRPVPTDWSKLDIRQAAFDAHRFVEALHWLYPGHWVNTGGSKGGMTSVYQRRFYPCDVDATVAYVAPTSITTTDAAYIAFLEQVGGSERAICRADLVAFQRRLLEQRAEIVPKVQGTFVQIDVDKAFELAVIELNFAFWQYTAPDDLEVGCSAIPPASATPEQMLAFLEFHSSPDVLAGEGSLDFYHAYYHQAAAQLGAPAPYEAPLADLLRYSGADVPASFIPAGEVAAFDTAAMLDINNWVASDGERMMFIYGELDPWSSREFVPSARDSHRFIVNGGNHGARISQLAEADRNEAMSLLARWLGVPTTVPRSSRPTSVSRRADSVTGDLTGDASDDVTGVLSDGRRALRPPR